jgi:hypothetical protein
MFILDGRLVRFTGTCAGPAPANLHDMPQACERFIRSRRDQAATVPF